MARIIVTGSNGQVGRELQVLAGRYPEFQFLFTNRGLLDISDAEALARFFNEQPADYCINCAAYTAVDKAEEEPEAAQLVNTTAVGLLAEQCAKHGLPLIHFSTDYVYHNGLSRPLLETDPVSPQSVYAKTKLAGEQAATEVHDQVMVLRTSWVYSAFGHNFLKTMLRLGQERSQVKVVSDQIGSPTYAGRLAGACLKVIQQHAQGSVGPERWHQVYHYSNEGECSWYDFATAIMRLAELDCEVLPIETKDFPTLAARPPYSLLSKAAFRAAYHMDIPHWEADLERMMGIYRSSLLVPA